MNSRLFFFTFLLFTVGLLWNGCSKETQNAEETLRLSDRLTAIDFRTECPAITIPAGSTDALAQAVADICDGGIIYLASGMHIENERVLINKPIKLIGEEGAILQLSGTPKPLDFPETAPDGNISVEVGLHFKDASGSLVQDIEFKPIENDGNTAILMENSSDSGIMRNKMNGFQFGVLVENSDRMTIMFNEIVSSSLWLNDLSYTDMHAITIINGKSAYIAQNEVSNSVFGIWGCDEWGTVESNNSHDNYIAYILCNVPTDYLTFPDGSLHGALKPASGYKVRNNVATNSFAEGYLVIDGAHDNYLENNAASNSGTYDMELTTLTLRFGIPAPEAYNNTVIVGDQPEFRVKNCGTNNTVVGGVLVDTSVDECN